MLVFGSVIPQRVDILNYFNLHFPTIDTIIYLDLPKGALNGCAAKGCQSTIR